MIERIYKKYGENMKEFEFAEFAIKGIKNRNKIKNINSFSPSTGIEDCFRSIFLFDANLANHVKEKNSAAGFNGKHIADEIIFDFDNKDKPELAQKEATNFIEHLHHKYEVPYDYIWVYFSGNKGFHVHIPIEAFTEEIIPHENFWQKYKIITLKLADGFNVDTSIYEVRRLIRLVNSVHSVSGLYKIPLKIAELKSLKFEQIRNLATKPKTIDILSKDEIEPVELLKEIYEHATYDNILEKQSSERTGTEINNALLFTGVNEGARHDILTKNVSWLIRHGHDDQSIIQACVEWNKKNSPPIAEKELQYQLNDLIKRFRTNNNGIFINFPICLLSIDGSETERLMKILCYSIVKEMINISSAEVKIPLNNLEEYYRECEQHIHMFEEFAPLIYARVGVNFLMETINNKNKYYVFAIYCGIVSVLGKSQTFPKIIFNQQILYRASGFRNAKEYNQFCRRVRSIDLITDYRRRNAIDILGPHDKNMIRFASLKKRSVNYYSTYYKTNKAIIDYLVRKEKSKIDKKYMETIHFENARREIADYKSKYSLIK